MAKVTLYKINCTKAFSMVEQGEGYSLTPWGDNTASYEGSDDGGKEYNLPDGYSVAQTKAGDMAIYDQNNCHCAILVHSSGGPQLVSSALKRPVLDLAL